MHVADLSREEFEEAHAGMLAGGGDERRQRGRGDRDELLHDATARQIEAHRSRPSVSHCFFYLLFLRRSVRVLDASIRYRPTFIPSLFPYIAEGGLGSAVKMIVAQIASNPPV